MTALRAGQLSPPGDGGISVIAVAGEGAAQFVASRLEATDAGARLRPGKLVYGRFLDAAGEPLDEVIAACRSLTYIEVNCHGGAVPARRILRSIADAGARAETPDEPPAEGSGRLEREALDALVRARTDLAARVLAAQYGGALRRALEQALEALSDAPRPVEHALEVLRRVSWATRIGLALAQPSTVVLQGPVNAGKSTLVNALAGFCRTIVSDVPGTTRDAVGVPVSAAGIPLMLVDTAGAGVSRDGLDAKASRRAQDALSRADATIVVVDTSAALPEGYMPRVKEGRTVIAANKSDIGVDAGTAARIAQWQAPVIRTSGFAGAGVDELSRAVLGTLGVPLPSAEVAEMPAAWTPRQAEAVRAAIKFIEAGDATAATARIRALLT